VIACVDVPALALQLVLRAHPEWSGDPVVVVEDDRPHAPILWSNRAAREHRIRRGTSFSQAKALSATLHAEVVSEPALEAAIDTLFELLIAFCPSVEPVLVQPGLFWLDPQGMDGLFGSRERWAERVHDKLRGERFFSAVVVGFARARAFALACTRTGPFVVRDQEQEQALSARVSLERLGIAPKLRDELALLDIHTVGELLALPVAQLRVRYGEQAARLHDFLSGKAWAPLLPRIPVAPLRVELEVEPPDDDCARLLFGLKAALHQSTERLRTEHHAITALDLLLELERVGGGNTRHERIETAAPTLDVVQLVDLLRLRLANVALGARVERIVTTIEHTRVHPRQLAIAQGDKPRDLEAAARAIARLRATFGPDAVTCARLCDAYLPEASFRFEPTRALQLPRAMPSAVREAELPLVRRVYQSPLALPPLPIHEPEAWLGRYGAVSAMLGPHRIGSGWWTERGAFERDYYFVETQTGKLLWVFFDRRRRKWLLQGLVE
jgi:protein ImuB